MGYVLLLVGLVLTVAGVRDRQGQLYEQLGKDFSGPNSFVWWVVSIGAIGSLGYAPQLQGLSRAFLALVLIVLVLSNGTVFQQFTSALQGSANPNGAK